MNNTFTIKHIYTVLTSGINYRKTAVILNCAFSLFFWQWSIYVWRCEIKNILIAVLVWENIYDMLACKWLKHFLNYSITIINVDKRKFAVTCCYYHFWRRFIIFIICSFQQSNFNDLLFKIVATNTLTVLLICEIKHCDEIEMRNNEVSFVV